MKKSDLPIPVQKLVLLQAYLFEIFSFENKCKKNFKNTRWYLKEKYTEEEVNSIIDYFENIDLKCDCDIIKKLEVKEIAQGLIKSHK